MDPRTRQRTNKIFGKLQNEPKKRKKPDDCFFLHNDRNPSCPRSYDESRSSSRKKRSTSTCNQRSENIYERKVHKQCKNKSEIIESDDNDLKSRDFDDDDSVADKTYDPLLAGDLSSSDSEKDFMSRAKRVKKQLFTPIKRPPLKEKKPSQSKTYPDENNMLLVKSVIENYVTPKKRKLSTKMIKHNQQMSELNANNNLSKKNLNSSVMQPDDIIMKESDYLAQTFDKTLSVQQDIDINFENTSNIIITTHHNTLRSEQHIDWNEKDQLLTPDDIGFLDDVNNTALINLNIETSDIVSDIHVITSPRCENATTSLEVISRENVQTDNIEIADSDILLSPAMLRTRPVVNSSTKKNPRKRVMQPDDIIMKESDYLAQTFDKPLSVQQDIDINFEKTSNIIITTHHNTLRSEQHIDLNEKDQLLTPDDLGFVDDINNTALINLDIETSEIVSNIQVLTSPRCENPTVETSLEVNPTENVQTDNIEIADGDILLSPAMSRTRPVANSSTKKNPRKRVRKVEQWKRVANKTRRLQGLPYISTVAKKQPEIKARQLKPPCKENCRNKCQVKLPENRREQLFDGFWKKTETWDQRRQYIVNNIEVSIKKMMKTTSTLENDKRKYTFTYNVPAENGQLAVCKTMFLNTFDISEKFVRCCIEKKQTTGLVLPDQRGKHVPGNKTSEHIIESVVKHISSFPSYESHYNRENTTRKFLGPELNLNEMYKQYVLLMKQENAEEQDIAKSWLYREIFNTRFNLSFKLLEMDTCDDCDRFQRLIIDTNDAEEKQNVVTEKEKHLKEAEKRYQIKKEDKEKSLKNENVRVLFLDLQKCLPTPYLTNTQSFYLRKLWTLNLTIYEGREKTASNFVWPEMIAGRGGNEIASCLIKWAQQNLSNATITETITWTDNCSGQNRNMMLIMAYFWLMQKYSHIETMSHKFLLKGHTHMEVDHVHSIIERKKKKLSTMEIAVPRDWAQFLRSCSGKNAFNVTEMTREDFKDCSSLSKKGSGPFVPRKKNTEQEEFKISNTVMWQFRRSKPGVLLYKTCFDQNNFKELNLVRTTRQTLRCPEELPIIRDSDKPISSAKFKDLMTLLQWVPKDFHSYYKSLSHSHTASDLPEID